MRYYEKYCAVSDYGLAFTIGLIVRPGMDKKTTPRKVHFEVTLSQAELKQLIRMRLDADGIHLPDQVDITHDGNGNVSVRWAGFPRNEHHLVPHPNAIGAPVIGPPVIGPSVIGARPAQRTQEFVSTDPHSKMLGLSLPPHTRE